jgi:hypothetical protein
MNGTTRCLYTTSHATNTGGAAVAPVEKWKKTEETAGRRWQRMSSRNGEEKIIIIKTYEWIELGTMRDRHRPLLITALCSVS